MHRTFDHQKAPTTTKNLAPYLHQFSAVVHNFGTFWDKFILKLVLI